LPAASTRRHFLSQAAGAAAGSTVLAQATLSPVQARPATDGAVDPVYGLIEAHKAADATYNAACVEQSRLESLGNWETDAGVAGDAAMGAFRKLIETAPLTFAGLVAWASYPKDRRVDARRGWSDGRHHDQKSS
jgi:hypothetical protein